MNTSSTNHKAGWSSVLVYTASKYICQLLYETSFVCQTVPGFPQLVLVENSMSTNTRKLNVKVISWTCLDGHTVRYLISDGEIQNLCLLIPLGNAPLRRIYVGATAPRQKCCWRVPIIISSMALSSHKSTSRT